MNTAPQTFKLKEVILYSSYDKYFLGGLGPFYALYRNGQWIQTLGPSDVLDGADYSNKPMPLYYEQ